MARNRHLVWPCGTRDPQDVEEATALQSRLRFLRQPKPGQTPLEGTSNLASVEDVWKNNALRIVQGRLRAEAPPNFPSGYIFGEFKKCIQYLYSEIDHGLWRTLDGYSRGNLKTGGTYGASMTWTEAKMKNDRSILSAWPKFHEKVWPWEQLPRL